MSISNWEKASTIINFISGVVIAIFAIAITISYSEQQNKITKKQTTIAEEQTKMTKMQTLATFLPYIREANSKEEKEYAINKIKEFFPEEVNLLAKVYPNQKEIKDAVDLTFSEVIEIKKSNPQLNNEGWIYLGEYNNDNWVKSYIITNDKSPKELEGSKVSIKQGHKINIRLNPPNTFGKMAPVVDLISDNSSIKIENVKEWYSTGFIWAKIKY